jgi:ketosteroid isomerase-like protein
MLDTEHRRLCHALFDALETGDVDAVDACYAPDMSMWANFTMSTIDRGANLDAIEKGKAIQRRRTYDDRVINTFHDGFVAQYTCRVVTNSGKKVALSACLVGTVHDGKIVRLDEYLDSGRFR